MNGLSEELEWLKSQAEKEGISKEDKKMLLRIANNYKYTHDRMESLSLNASWTNNPERMGR